MPAPGPHSCGFPWMPSPLSGFHGWLPSGWLPSGFLWTAPPPWFPVDSPLATLLEVSACLQSPLCPRHIQSTSVVPLAALVLRRASSGVPRGQVLHWAVGERDSVLRFRSAWAPCQLPFLHLEAEAQGPALCPPHSRTTHRELMVWRLPCLSGSRKALASPPGM